MTKRRTTDQVEQDVLRIKEAAKEATTWEMIEKITGLSYYGIRKSLESHPIIRSKIQKQLDVNKAKAKQTAKVTKFVIDASMAGVKNCTKILKEITDNGDVIILTSITVPELHRIEKRKQDARAWNARRVLEEAALNQKSYRKVTIDETLNTPDACIVEYCRRHPGVILMTADKEMAVDAGECVEVRFFPQSELLPSFNRTKETTLYQARRFGKNLMLLDMKTDRRSMLVVSGSKKYTEGPISLKIGDQVYVAAKKFSGFTTYISFLVFRMISLYEKDNCILVYSKRIYDFREFNIPDQYRGFVEQFIFEYYGGNVQSNC